MKGRFHSRLQLHLSLLSILQIAEIKRRELLKKAQIAAFPKVMDDELSHYVSTLHEKEHTLKELQNDLGRLMRECHITEVIRENKENRRRVNEALQLTTGECSILREMMAAPTGMYDIWVPPSLPIILRQGYNF